MFDLCLPNILGGKIMHLQISLNLANNIYFFKLEFYDLQFSFCKLIVA